MAEKKLKKQDREITKKFIEKQVKSLFLEGPKESAISFLDTLLEKLDGLSFIEQIRNGSSRGLSKKQKQELGKALAPFLVKGFKLDELSNLLEKSKETRAVWEELDNKERELARTQFEEAKRLRTVPIDREFFEIVPYIIPGRLSERSLVKKEILSDNRLYLSYQRESRGKSITFTFLVPEKVLGKIKEKDIPTVGVNMRRALCAALAFAFVKNTTSPTFTRSELVDLMGEDTQRASKLYQDINKGLLTWAYGTYTILSQDKVVEVGHIVNRVKLAEKRGERTLVEFNRDVVRPLLKLQMETGNLNYISYPTELVRVKPKDMSLYTRNFCESLLNKQGMGRNVYPKYAKNMLIQDFGVPPKKLSNLSSGQIHKILTKGLIEAKHRGLLKGYGFTMDSMKNAPLDIRRWKVKLVMPSKQKDKD